MVALFLTDGFDDVYAFDREIARPTAGMFSRLIGDDYFDTTHERLIQEFKKKGFGKRPLWRNRFRVGEQRAMRIDVDEKTQDVLITNGYCYKNGVSFIPYGTDFQGI